MPTQPHTDILAHMERHHGPVRELALQEIVPTLGAAIHVIPPEHGRKRLTLFTAGMSDRSMNVPPGQDDYQSAEIFIRLPAERPLTVESFRNPGHFWPFQWLRRIAAYPHENNTWLGGPRTVIA